FAERQSAAPAGRCRENESFDRAGADCAVPPRYSRSPGLHRFHPEFHGVVPGAAADTRAQPPSPPQMSSSAVVALPRGSTSPSGIHPAVLYQDQPWKTYIDPGGTANTSSGRRMRRRATTEKLERSDGALWPGGMLVRELSNPHDCRH